MSEYVRHAAVHELPQRQCRSRETMRHLDFEITERCNNDCTHCYINRSAADRAARESELDTAEVLRVLGEAADLGALSVRLTGGEPLLRADFAEIYLAARRLGLRVGVCTNATLITAALADLFASVPPLAPVEVSVYGMSAASCAAVTRRDLAFDECQRGLALLRERHVDPVVKGVLVPATADELAEFDAWTITQTGASTPAAVVALLQLRGRRDGAARNHAIAAQRLPADQLIKALSRDRARYLAEMRQFCASFMGPHGDRLFACGAGQSIAVDPYGVAQPCLTLRHPECVYDLRDGSLREALTGFFAELRERRATNPDYLLRCGRCFLKGLCEQCPARSWSEHGTLDTAVEYLCDVAHEQARDLGLLRAGERAWEVGDWQGRVASFVESGRRGQ